jgi:hypothetical protein
MSRIVLLVAFGVAIALFLATSATLPATVATHFAAGGRADGFMTRIGYQVFYCALMTFMVVVTYGSLTWLPARFPHLLNLPSRDYWMAPQRRVATLATLRAFGVAMALLTVTLLVAIHLLVVDAHDRTPPTLHEAAVFAIVGAFVALLVALLVAIYMRFRTPG